MAQPDRDQPDVTTIVVTHQNSDIVARCLEALQGAVEHHTQEIIVVDNASTDGTAAAVLAHESSATVLALSRNIGFAAANNVALSRARGRYVALVNSDCFPDSRALDLLIEAADRNPAAGLVGGTLRYGNGKHQPSAGQLPTIRSEFWVALGLHRAPLLKRIGVGVLFAEAFYRQRRPVGWVSGAFCLARPAIGEIPADSFMYGEDVEWARQATDRGFEVWLEPRATAVHLGGRSVARSQRSDFVEVQRVKFSLRWFADRGIGARCIVRLILFVHALRKLATSAVTALVNNRSAGDPARRFVRLTRVILTGSSRVDTQLVPARHDVDVQEVSRG